MQTDKSDHGRSESRTYVQLEAPAGQLGRGAWRGLRSIVEVQHDGGTSDDVHHLIIRLPVEGDTKGFAHVARSHWDVQNLSHWTLDVTYREDESRVRESHLGENLMWLNRFSPWLQKEQPGRETVAMKRRG